MIFPAMMPALEAAVAPMPGFSGFGSSTMVSTTYSGSLSGKPAMNALKRIPLT